MAEGAGKHEGEEVDLTQKIPVEKDGVIKFVDDPNATGDFVPLDPVKEFENAVKNIDDRVEIFKMAARATKDLKNLRREQMNYRDNVEKKNKEETQETLQNEKEIQRLEDQINAIEEHAQQRALEIVKQKSA